MKKKLLLGVAALGLAGITSIFSPVLSNANEKISVVSDDVTTIGYSSCPLGHDNKEFLEIGENLLTTNVHKESYDTYTDIAGQSYSYSISYKLIPLNAGKYYHYRYENTTPFVTAFINYASGPQTIDYTISNNTVCFGFPGDENDMSSYGVCLVTKTNIDSDDEGEYVEGVEGWLYEAGDYLTADMTPPTVEFNAVFTVNVDEMKSLEEITSHIIVKDENDTNPKIIIDSTTYDSSVRKIGTYEVIFHAEDEAGNRTDTYSFRINVVDVKNPTITCDDIRIGNQKVLSSDEIYAYFTVSDNYSNRENIRLTTKSDNYTSNATKPGTYNYTVQATDEAGNTKEHTINITVYDNTPPTITGTGKIQFSTSKLSISDLLSLFNVSDDVTVNQNIRKEIITDNYTANYQKAGTYAVTCRATDEAGNTKEYTINIVVSDKIPPTINNATKTVEYSSLKIEDYKSLFTYLDESTEHDNIVFKVISDGYKDKYNKVGTYVVNVEVEDEAGNVSKATLTITVIDTTAPVISGKDIAIGNSSKYTLDEIKSGIVVNDGHDGTITNYEINDKNKYLEGENYKKIGEYYFDITARDQSGNTSKATIKITVSDTTAPEVFYDNYFILVRVGESLTNEMIISYATQVLGLESSEAILNINGEYDTAVEGEYSVAVTLDSGEVEIFSIIVGENTREPLKWSLKTFFSTNMDNWTDFSQWKSWSIVAWLSWCGVGLGLLLVLRIILSILKKRK